MKLTTNIYIIFLLFSCFTFSQTGEILVRINGFRNNHGQVNVVLFNQSKGFPSEYKYGLISKSQPVDTSLITFTFDSLSYGEYAVSVLHDENKNGKMDTNFLGIPREGYGVSNNIKPKMRPPRFDEAVFELKIPREIINITLHYR